jgi:hypothetical protein
MMKWIGAAMLVFMLTLGSAATEPAAAASLETAASKPDMKAARAGARRHVRHAQHYAYGPYHQPTYLDRPYYYAPAPNLALAFGFGFGPWW